MGPGLAESELCFRLIHFFDMNRKQTGRQGFNVASVCKRRSGSESLAKLQLAEEKPLLNGLILNHSNIRLSFQRLVAMKNCHFRIAAVLSDIEASSNRGTTRQSAAPSILTEKTSYFLAEPAVYAASQTPTPVPEDTAYCAHPNQAYPTTAATAPVAAPVQQAAAAAPPLTTTLTTESICVAGG
ncbi:hypothetical protein IGI04_008937 [Brassica rapa subsp. trilocularis]|uniref:LOB domain-containing protein n=2 Tax=Brassica campestris TaxID=3711 RepID=A0ABQ7MVV4_BRACM